LARNTGSRNLKKEKWIDLIGLLTDGNMEKLSNIPLALLLFADIATAQSLQTDVIRYTYDDATVIDNETGLRWQRCSVGQKWRPDNKCIGKPTQLNFLQAQRFSLGYSRNVPEWMLNAMWRVPTRNELKTLIDLSKSPLKINTEMFPDIDMKHPWYWTSDMHNDGQAWFVDFRDGHIGFITGDHINAQDKLSVRLVHLEK